MHLARLTLDLRNTRARRDLADAYDMHRTLVRAFVADSNDTPPRFLWRVEPESAWREPMVVVQSEQAADWSAFNTSNYLQKTVESKTVDLHELIAIDSRYRFRLFANPTVTQAGKRFGLSSEESQIEWLERKADKSGFDVETVLVTGSDVMDVKRGDIRLQQASFEGVLTAREPDVLAQVIQQGLGPGKAFGLGMLSVAPR